MRTQIVVTLANDITLGEYVTLMREIRELSPEYVTDLEVKVYD